MEKYTFLLFSILVSNLCYPQKSVSIERREKVIMKQYDSIQYSDIIVTSNRETLKKLVEQSKRLNYRSGIARGLILLQSQTTRQGDYGLSEKYGDQAEEIAAADKDYNFLSLIAINRANTAIGLGLLLEAKEILRQNKPNAAKIPNKADKARYFANSYLMLSGVYSRLRKNDSVIYYTKKSLNVLETVPVRELTNFQKAKYYHLYIYQLMNFAIICMEKQSPPDPALAESYIKRALQFSKTHPQYFQLCDIEVYETASYIYLEKKQYEKSIYFSKKVLEIEGVKKKPEERLAAYSDLKDAYKALNNKDEELKYLNLYVKLNDSLDKIQRNTVINETRNEISRSKKEITKEYNEDKRNIAVGEVGIILFVTWVSWYYVRRKKSKYREKYIYLIDKIKKENTIQQTSIKKETESNKNILSSTTEKKLLKKLEAFENSEKFLKKEMTLTNLSSILNTNPKYLSEVIKTHKSKTFNNYINSLRIEYIVHKLYNEAKYLEYKISYLAEECGYASPQVFVIAFKKENGVTPSYFINELKSKTGDEYKEM